MLNTPAKVKIQFNKAGICAAIFVEISMRKMEDRRR
jgi:hypothetical protein